MKNSKTSGRKTKPVQRPCLTREAHYTTVVTPHRIVVTVDVPDHIDLCAPDENEHMHGTLETRAHDGMEWVLGPWFYHATHERRRELIQKKGWPDFHLSPEETAELADLDAYVNSLAAFSETPADNESMMIIREAAALIRKSRVKETDHG